MKLVATELIEAAREKTGLAEFGGERFREGLEALTAALESEADLHEAGRTAARARLLALLRNRLEIEDWRRRHPQIASHPVVAPVFVVGLPRTGTTALAALLARDPATRVLRSWESQRPVPPPDAKTQHGDPRIALAQAGIDAMTAAHPQWPTLYDGSATSSTECQDLLGMEFRTWHFCGEYWIPGYEAWQRGADMQPAYAMHRRTLELLHWRCPPRRWLLHAPVHTLTLEALARAYPDARFVLIHRDPARVLGSTCSLIGFMRSLASDRREPHALGREQLALWSGAMESALRFRDRAAPSRFADLPFRELVAEPVAAVERLYAQLDWPFAEETRAAVADWAAAHPRGRHGAHRYRLADFGLEAAAVRERFRFYTERFDVPLEREPGETS